MSFIHFCVDVVMPFSSGFCVGLKEIKLKEIPSFCFAVKSHANTLLGSCYFFCAIMIKGFTMGWISWDLFGIFVSFIS